VFSTSVSKGQLFKLACIVAALVFAFGLLREKGYVTFSEREADLRILAKFQTSEERRQAAAYTQYLFGLLYEHRGYLDSAVRKFRTVKSFDPGSALNRVHLGVNLVHSNRKEEVS